MQTLLRLFGSLKLGAALLLALFFLVLAGTLAQAQMPNQEAQDRFFRAWLVWAGPVPLPAGLTLFSLLAVNLAASALRHFTFRLHEAGLWVLHLGLVLMAGAGLAMGLGQEEFTLGIWKGGQAEAAFTKPEGREAPLPFSLALDDFEREVWPGTDIPKAYSARLTVRQNSRADQAVLALNQPLRLDGWTIFLTGLNREAGGREGAVFLLVRNPWSFLPYLFSGLIVAGFLLHLWLRRPRTGVTA